MRAVEIGARLECKGTGCRVCDCQNAIGQLDRGSNGKRRAVNTADGQGIAANIAVYTGSVVGEQVTRQRRIFIDPERIVTRIRRRVDGDAYFKTVTV